MKKLHISAFALLFTLIICVPELVIVSAEGRGKSAVQNSERRGSDKKPDTQGRSRAIWLRQAVKQYPFKRRELTLKQKLKLAREELARNREILEKVEELSVFTPQMQKLIPEIHFMCVCPTPCEFLSVYESLSSSEIFTKRCDISVEDITKLEKKLCTQDNIGRWHKFIKEHPMLDKRLQPICFFTRKIDETEETLCLALCGKGSASSVSFASNSKIFINLEHVLICGICGCTKSEIAPGSALFCTEYVTLAGNVGNPALAGPKKREIYIQGERSYFTNPQFISCNSESSLLSELNQVPGIRLMPAMNFSFDTFIEDSVLAQSMDRCARQRERVGCIDMEGVPLANQFYEMDCTVHSLRIVSDHAGPRSSGFLIEGKKSALAGLVTLSNTFIDCWMAHKFVECDSLFQRKPSMIRPGDDHCLSMVPPCKSPKPGDAGDILEAITPPPKSGLSDSSSMLRDASENIGGRLCHSTSALP